jgi:hypothetical protein
MLTPALSPAGGEGAIGTTLSEPLLNLSDAVDDWVDDVEILDPSDMRRFHELAKIALRAIEQRDKGNAAR